MSAWMVQVLFSQNWLLPSVNWPGHLISNEQGRCCQFFTESCIITHGILPYCWHTDINNPYLVTTGDIWNCNRTHETHFWTSVMYWSEQYWPVLNGLFHIWTGITVLLVTPTHTYHLLMAKQVFGLVVSRLTHQCYK